MNKKLLIFDLDGTLINSVEDLAAATNYALGKHGFQEHAVEKFYRFVGDGVVRLIERALPPAAGANPEIVSGVKADFDEYYRAHYAVRTKAYDGVAEMLAVFKLRGYILCVVSNKPEEFCREIVNEFFGGVFDEVLGGSKKFPQKPAPEIVLFLLDKYGRSRKDCTIIGDSDVDIITGKNAEIKTVGVSWGFRGEAELSEAGADYIVHSADEITEIL